MDADLSAVDVAVCDLLELDGCGAVGHRLDRGAGHLFPGLRREPEAALPGLFHTGDGCVRPTARCLGPDHLPGRDWLIGRSKASALSVWDRLSRPLNGRFSLAAGRPCGAAIGC